MTHTIISLFITHMLLLQIQTTLYTIDRNDDASVILAKQTTLTETQKSALRKG